MLFTTTLLTLLTSSVAFANPQSSGDGDIALGEAGCRVDDDCFGFGACRVASLPLDDGTVAPLELRCVGGLGARVGCGSNVDCQNLNCGCTTEDDGVFVCCEEGADKDFEEVLSGSSIPPSNGPGN